MANAMVVSISDSILVCDLPPGGRDQNNFSLFRLFRGNGSWCRISRIQSPSHHIISKLKSSPQRFRSFIAHSAQDSTHFFAPTFLIDGEVICRDERGNPRYMAHSWNGLGDSRQTKSCRTLTSALSSESRLFPWFADLEFLDRPFRRGRRIRCLDKADELGGLSP